MRLRGPYFPPLLVAVIGLLWVASELDHQFNNIGAIKKYRTPQILTTDKGGYQPGGLTMVLQLGGLRGLAANLLWMETDNIWHSGEWYKMLPMMRVILKLDPHFIDVWQTFGRHLAWNINAAAKEQVEKDRAEGEKVQQQLAQLARYEKAGRAVDPQEKAALEAELAGWKKKIKDDEAIAQSWIQRGIELDEEVIRKNPNR